MADLTIILPGRPPSKKNNPVMVKSRNLILPNKAYRDFHKFAIGTRSRPGWLLIHYGNQQFTDPVEMVVDYYLADRRIPDLTNLQNATADLLESAGILYNDNLILEIHGAISGIDRKHPRQEIQLTIKIPDWWGK